MDNLRDSLLKKTIAIETKSIKTIAIVAPTTKQANAIVDQATDLINDQKFRPYFFKTLKIIGPTNFYEAMDFARKTDASCRPCMFVKRLKELRDRYETE